MGMSYEGRKEMWAPKFDEEIYLKLGRGSLSLVVVRGATGINQAGWRSRMEDVC